jgi:hypothetical protein
MRLPSEPKEASLAFFGLARAYLRLASIARKGRVSDNERRQIELETMDALPLAAMVEDQFGTQAHEQVPKVQQTLQQVFDSACNGWH